MQTFAILDFPLPGSPGFPLNALYGKPENKGEEGMLLYQYYTILYAQVCLHIEDFLLDDRKEC